MRIKRRLQINVIVSVLTAFIICLLLALSLYRINRANNAAIIAGELITSAFERIALRNDYMRNNNLRAKEQWFTKSEEIAKLLKSAQKDFRDGDDRRTITGMIKNNESIGKIFSAIVANREESGVHTGTAGVSREVEERLLNQLNMRVYGEVLRGRELQESSKEARASALSQAGAGIISVLAILIVAAMINTWTLGRAIADRVLRLRKGTAVIGDGSLDHRIDVKGDDEFAEISKAINVMTARLARSYHSLEDEIEERKRAEEALRDSEERITGILESMTDGCIVFDAQWRYVYINSSGRRILSEEGTDPDALLGRSHWEAFPATVGTEIERAYRLVMAEREPAQIEICYEPWKRWFYIKIQPMHDGGVSLFYQDITERKQAEAQISRDVDNLTSMHALSSRLLVIEGVALIMQDIMDTAVTIMKANLGTLQLLEGETLRIVAHHGHKDMFLNFFAAAESQASVCGEARKRGGRVIVEDIESSPLFAGTPSLEILRDAGVRAVQSTPMLNRKGELLGILTTQWVVPYLPDEHDLWRIDLLARLAADLIEHKQAEEALKRLNEELEERVVERTAELRERDQMLLLQSRQAAMGEMIGNIAHQWRQPLNAIGLGIQQLVLFYDLGEFNRELLGNNVLQSMELIRHMSKTIDDFRNYFRPDKEKIEFKVREAIADTLSLIEDSYKNQHIGIEVVAMHDPVIFGYPNEFAQALLNILNNAKDALTERGAKDPKVTITITGGEGGRAVVTVADNAGGIAEGIMNKIFDPYFTTKGPQQGTGVGLFMSKAIIEKNMGGLLSARNIADGAEFRIEV